jgi:hypothetical protein
LKDAGLGTGLEGVKLKRDSSLDLNNIAYLNNGETRVIEVFQEKGESTSTQGPLDAALWFFGGKEQRDKKKSAIIVTISAYYNN